VRIGLSDHHCAHSDAMSHYCHQCSLWLPPGVAPCAHLGDCLRSSFCGWLVHWSEWPLVAPCPASRARPGLCLLDRFLFRFSSGPYPAYGIPGLRSSDCLWDCAHVLVSLPLIGPCSVHWTLFVTLPWPFVLLGIYIYIYTIRCSAFTAAWPLVPQLSAGPM